MEFRVLGPLEVTEGGRPISLGGPKQRSVLAILLLNANRVVSTDLLVDEIWGEHAGAGATRALQVYVSNLRKLLERARPAAEGRCLLTRSPGYVLSVEPDQFDLLRFESLCKRGREALAAKDAAAAAAALREGLLLWRGPALADFVYQPFAQREAVHLEEARIAALEDRVEADLALGRHVELAAELERIVAEHPLRERPWRQLMLALYRSGRQSDALRAYGRLRHKLGDELGIEPSAELARLEEAILLHSPALDGVDAQPASPTATGTTKPLPTGVVSLLLTDIEGSTGLWEARPQAMALALARHEELLHAAVTAHGGIVLKARGEGDSTFSVFDRATDAVTAAVSAQRAFLLETWPEGVVLAVRMAVHAGETVERDGDYYGPTVNRVARVRGLAQGGQILVTQSATDVARHSLPAGTRLSALGPHLLQGIAEPEHVFALVGEGLARPKRATTASSDEEPGPKSDAFPSTAYFEIMKPDGHTFVSLYGHRMTIGRSLDNNIAFPQEQAVSRVHAVLERFAGAWCLRDLGSRNGTLLNGEQVRGERVLREGDDLRVGPVRLLFSQDEATSEATATG